MQTEHSLGTQRHLHLDSNSWLPMLLEKLGLSFCICKMGFILGPASRSC